MVSSALKLDILTLTQRGSTQSKLQLFALLQTFSAEQLKIRKLVIKRHIKDQKNVFIQAGFMDLLREDGSVDHQSR